MVHLFGTTLKETKDAFGAAHFGSDQNIGSKDDKLKAIGRIVVSILLVFLATFLYTSSNDKSMANTIVGALIGYWIK